MVKELTTNGGFYMSSLIVGIVLGLSLCPSIIFAARSIVNDL